MNGCLRTDQHLTCIVYVLIHNNFASVVTYHFWSMEACIVISVLKSESGGRYCSQWFFNVFSALSVPSPIIKENLDWTTLLRGSWSSELCHAQSRGSLLFWQCRLKLWLIAHVEVLSGSHMTQRFHENGEANWSKELFSSAFAALLARASGIFSYTLNSDEKIHQFQYRPHLKPLYIA